MPKSIILFHHTKRNPQESFPFPPATLGKSLGLLRNKYFFQNLLLRLFTLWVDQNLTSKRKKNTGFLGTPNAYLHDKRLFIPAFWET
jgi:hypothetical protein